MGHQASLNRRGGERRNGERGDEEEGSFVCADMEGSPRHIKHEKQGARKWV